MIDGARDFARDSRRRKDIPRPFPERREPELRVNRRIRAREVRVIDPNGQQLGIMPPEMALQKAIDLGLDLVEVSPESRPPVCRILDYGKYKYALKKKESEARKNQVNTTVKEVKFRPKIERHDYEFKVDAIKRFLGEGHKAKVTMMFRGRELAHQDIARGIMQRILNDVKEVGAVEQFPKLDGRNMVMVVAPQGKVVTAPVATAPRPSAMTPAPQPAAQEAGNAKV